MTRRLFNTSEHIRLPQPPPPQITPAGFVICAVHALPGQSPELWAVQQWLFQQAFALAQAVLRPSLPERDLLGYWN